MVEFHRTGQRPAVAVLTWPKPQPRRGDARRADGGLLQTTLVDLLGSHGPRLVLDLADMACCDTATAQAIQHADRRARRRGGWVRVVTEHSTVTGELARHDTTVVYPNVACALVAS